MNDERTISEDQAEEAVMGWELMGKLPEGWTRGTLANAYIILANRNERELSKQPEPSPGIGKVPVRN